MLRKQNIIAMNNEQLKNKLEEITNESGHSIRKEVAQEALDYTSENIADFFSDLLEYGCVSGMISILVYYADTHAFFNKHYAEIEELRYEQEEMLGHALTPNGDLMNWYTWFAFEETAQLLANELGLNI